MTQAQLAQKVNCQANDIKLLESGDAIKNQGLLNRVARVLKVSPKLVCRWMTSEAATDVMM